MFPYTPPAESARFNIAYLDMMPQLLDLFMTWDWSTYFYDYGQENSKYLKWFLKKKIKERSLSRRRVSRRRKQSSTSQEDSELSEDTTDLK
ncbi:uncharacterized protein LOC143240517 isoform X8 [Tachypleus tridentatus]|uniref:uncharacterized protein LOC143240517 isoform X8 n=1 Tax=Tachypleus tridentatus TaxID=6853 RepID=UPI003FD39196